MEYAIIEIGGTQQRVQPGDLIRVDRISDPGGREGETLRIDRVLLVRAGDGVTVGTPLVPGASVRATVLGEIRARKVMIFKKKKRKQYRRTVGHRQRYTTLRIEEIRSGA